MEQQTVARVGRNSHAVENVEIADDAWIETNQNDPWFMFIKTPDPEGNHAVIGLRYFPRLGLFQQPGQAVEEFEGAFEVPVIKEEKA